MKSYSDRFTEFSDSDLETISHVKRMIENIMGDEKFRSIFLTGGTALDEASRIRGCDPLILECREALSAYLERTRFEVDLPPPLKLWQRFTQILAEYKKELTSIGSSSASEKFNRWRQRQICRVQSQLGNLSEQIVHPIAAFELSIGCTVGCKFCGVSADKFGGHVPFNEFNAAEWQAVLSAFNARFGGAMSTSFCYWATDPLDNPDYDKFVEVFYDQFGVMPQMTTAIPLRNADLTKRVLQLSESRSGTPNRFSILSSNVLRRVMNTFTARDLLHVEMVLQMPGGTVNKANAGKNFNADLASVSRPSSIACVTGFLVNIGTRTIRLVSPTAASTEWPNGYMTFAEENYKGAEDFGEVLDRLIERLEPRLEDASLLKFRGDLSFARNGEGFELTGAVTQHSFRKYGDVAERVSVDRISLSTLDQDLGTSEQTLIDRAEFVSGLYNAGLVEICTPDSNLIH